MGPSQPSVHTTCSLVLLGYLMAFLGEALCYLLVYSKSEFQKLNCETVKLWREYYELEQECGGGPDGRVGGRAGRAAAAVQAKIQRKTKSLTGLKQKGVICVGLLFLICMPLIHSLFEGVPGAVLPFSLFFPFTMFGFAKPEAEEGGPQQQPAGNEAPLCSASAIFMISMLLAKIQMQKALGVALPGGLQQQTTMAAPAS